MKEVSKSAFALIQYKISNFSLLDPAGAKDEIGVDFKVEGRLMANKQNYLLKFQFEATVENEAFIMATMEAEFHFQEMVDIQSIPDYFYANSIAIAFPYLRAFVTTLTAVANLKPLILPTLNLSGLGSSLKANTTSAS